MEEGAPRCAENERLRGMVLKAAGRMVEGAASFQNSVGTGTIDEAVMSFAAMISTLTKCEAAYAAWSEHCGKHKCR